MFTSHSSFFKTRSRKRIQTAAWHLTVPDLRGPEQPRYFCPFQIRFTDGQAFAILRFFRKSRSKRVAYAASHGYKASSTKFTPVPLPLPGTRTIPALVLRPSRQFTPVPLPLPGTRTIPVLELRPSRQFTPVPLPLPGTRTIPALVLRPSRQFTPVPLPLPGTRGPRRTRAHCVPWSARPPARSS